MTKEELEKEVRKYLKKTFYHEYYDDVVMVMGFAEPREKRIEELEKENAELKRIVKMVAMINKDVYTEEGVTMFEKEAKKWVKEHTEIEYKASYGEFLREPSATKSFKAGAEFGYNKANEWHYVKDGDYPKDNQLVMVYRVNPLGANIAITNWYDSYKDTKVIAWKEIVLPKESE